MSAAIATPTVFITVPKYVAITPHPLTKICPAPANTTTTILANNNSISMDCTSNSSGSEDGTVARGKKRRLDHLTWEEKIQRKKLKNRVAAQTSRDRKKARMEEMEIELNDLTEKTEILENKCESLQAINDSLLEKNRQLDMEVDDLRKKLNELQQQMQQSSKEEATTTSRIVDNCAGCASILNGSAVSKYTDPLQQGSNKMDTQSTQISTQQQQQQQKATTMASLWRIVALCLLYKTCSYSTTTNSTSMPKNSMRANWKSLPKACWPISQQTWKQMIARATKMLPKMQAEQSDCLDQWWGPQQSAWNPADIEKELKKQYKQHQQQKQSKQQQQHHHHQPLNLHQQQQQRRQPQAQEVAA